MIIDIGKDNSEIMEMFSSETEFKDFFSNGGATVIMILNLKFFKIEY